MFHASQREASKVQFPHRPASGPAVIVFAFANRTNINVISATLTKSQPFHLMM
jgi:hypothetical protein